jgi:hypothetical protein
MVTAGCTGKDHNQPVPIPTVPKAPADITGVIFVYFGLFSSNTKVKSSVTVTLPTQAAGNFRSVPKVADCAKASGDTIKFGDRAGSQSPPVSVCVVQRQPVIFYAPHRYLGIPKPQLLGVMLELYLDWLKAGLQRQAHPHQLTDPERKCFTAAIQVGLRDAGYITKADYKQLYREGTDKSRLSSTLRTAYAAGAKGNADCFDY